MANEELVYLYQQGDKSALDELIESNKGIVYKLVNKYYVGKTNSIDREDLEQEGYIGLMVAADRYKFNIENPCKFSTYAVYWVNAKINRFITTKNTNEETSLNIPLNDDDKSELQDFIEGKDYGYENIEDQVYRRELRTELEEVMNEANTLREREILKLHYGWDNGREMTCREIGNIFNIPHERVWRVEHMAIRKIRDTKWGRLKIKEIYHDIELRNSWSIPGAIEKINFAENYLMGGIMQHE